MRLGGLALLLLALPAGAQMYKCVDEKGVTHYTDKPCAAGKGRQVDIRASPPISGKLQERSDGLSEQDAQFKRRQLEREQAESTARDAQERRCSRLRQEHGVLAAGTRVSRIGPSGERIYLEDAARDRRLAELKEALRACP